jgi:hypothetical protein
MDGRGLLADFGVPHARGAGVPPSSTTNLQIWRHGRGGMYWGYIEGTCRNIAGRVEGCDAAI